MMTTTTMMMMIIMIIAITVLILVVWCTVFGCADPPTSGNVWFKRRDVDSAEAEMGCRTTSEKWLVTCVDNQWKGTSVNCSHCAHFTRYSHSSSMIE